MDRKPVNEGAVHVCTAEQMRAADRAAVETAKIPGVVLMENAAIACSIEICRQFDVKNSSFAVFCGKGNNGGDGLAIARHLHNKGAEVYVYLTSGSDFSGDALINYEIVRALGIAVIEIENSTLLKNFVKSADCVIDAILGTGIRGAARGGAQAAIRAINEYAKYIISVDMPSGADSDTGAVLGDAVSANKTITFAAYKRGMFLYPAADCCGEIILADISMPEYIMEVKAGRCFASSMEACEKVFPKRRDNSHKGSYGKIMIVGGSVGMAGAVAMAAKGAMSFGAGLICAAVPAAINNIIQSKIDEVMTLPLPEEGGRISKSAAERLAKRANACDAVLFGPGVGRNQSVYDFAADFLPRLEVPCIVDADGIFAIAKNENLLAKCRVKPILTPHTMELSYLCGKTCEEIEASRFQTACDFSSKNEVTLILKGHHTIIAEPEGDVTVNTSGNSGMAQAGSGDCLAGMITALVARKVPAYDAAVCAVYLHGAAGDAAAEKYGKDAMTTNDMINEVCHILPVEK